MNNLRAKKVIFADSGDFLSHDETHISRAFFYLKKVVQLVLQPPLFYCPATFVDPPAWQDSFYRKKATRFLLGQRARFFVSLTVLYGVPWVNFLTLT